MERYSNGKEPHWKCGVLTRHCAFESHPLRQLKSLLFIEQERLFYCVRLSWRELMLRLTHVY